MKKLFITLAFLGASLLLVPAARAEYAFSITYGSPGLRTIHNDACSYNPGRGIACGPSYRVVRFPNPRPYRQQRRNTTRIVYVNTRVPVTTVVPQAPVEINEKVGISDIVVLSKAGISDSAIIEKIARTDSVFDLSVEEVVALRREGVSSRVVNYMLDTTR